MSDNPAKTIIDFLGGARVVAGIVGKHPSRVYRWTYPYGKREGSSGLVPAKEQLKILNFCKENGINLLPSDFFDGSRLRSLIDARGRETENGIKQSEKSTSSPVSSSAGEGGVPLVLSKDTPQPNSKSPELLPSGDAGVQPLSPCGGTPASNSGEAG